MEKNPGLRKGTWTQEEDNLLRTCVLKHGEGKWHLIPHRAGLNRCMKSCRMRWFNYLKPSIKRGSFTEDEVDMIRRFHKLLGNRWSLIAGRLPGSTANDVKNYWYTNMRNKKAENHKTEAKDHEKEPEEETSKLVKGHAVIKPQPHTFSKNSPWLRRNKLVSTSESGDTSAATSASFAQPCPPADFGNSNESEKWWESLLNKEGDEGQEWNSMMEFLDQDFLKMEDLQSCWSHYSKFHSL